MKNPANTINFMAIQLKVVVYMYINYNAVSVVHAVSSELGVYITKGEKMK